MIEWTMIADAMAHAEHEILPETFHFLHAGWWGVHIIMISLIFWAGMAVGRKKAIKPPPAA
jgi:hypothetical protein